MTRRERELLARVQRLSRGEVELVTGLRAVVAPMPEDLRESEPGRLLAFVESETDDYPGPDRDLWDAGALARLDAKWAAYLDSARPEVLAACDELAAMLAARGEA